MRGIDVIRGPSCSLFRDNIDTDQIIPKSFLKTDKRSGYEDALFHGWRYLADGAPDPDFPLNKSHGQRPQILIAGINFGCGSSREQAVWALRDYGIRAIVAESFADIFKSNCGNNGILTIALPPDTIRSLVDLSMSAETANMTISLSEQTLRANGSVHTFQFDQNLKDRLLRGLDVIDLISERAAQIERHESSRPRWMRRDLR